MSKEFYKRFRPKKLDEIVGNAGTVSELRAMFAAQTVPHAILLTGPSGAGKTTLARIIARELGCPPMRGDLRNPDFREFNAADDRGIDLARSIIDQSTLSPTSGDVRVIILDEAHQLTKAAQSSMLKLLEDTPEHAYFVLATTDPEKLLPTIRTRCRRLPVAALSADEVRRLVRRCAKAAGVEVSDDDVDGIVDVACGSARAALVLLDKVASLAPDEREAALSAGADDQREAIDLCRALIKGAPWAAVAKILKGLKVEDDEKVRHAVLGYAASVLSGGGKNDRAYSVLLAFERNFYDGKRAGLVRACYEATFAK